MKRGEKAEPASALKNLYSSKMLKDLCNILVFRAKLEVNLKYSSVATSYGTHNTP